ncbi:MAG: ABC transporter ATP-binding protein [Planctomycetes bacterium]|nr:ABC transporter ATP-binding protein [Planctomycetota bacterium]
MSAPSEPSEPSNPFYYLLLVVGLVFIVTVLAYAVIPVIEQKAMDAGQMPPDSPFRDALRNDGWKWVLAEVALLVVLGLASMGLDRWRRWHAESETSAAPNEDPKPPSAC